MNASTSQYKGFTITQHKNGGFVISRNDIVICSQPSIDFAKRWIRQYISHGGASQYDDKR